MKYTLYIRLPLDDSPGKVSTDGRSLVNIIELLHIFFIIAEARNANKMFIYDMIMCCIIFKLTQKLFIILLHFLYCVTKTKRLIRIKQDYRVRKANGSC